LRGGIGAASLLVAALRDSASVASLTPADWTALLTAARAERLLGSLAYRLDTRTVPAAVATILADARADAERERRGALWEAEMARRALAPLGIPVVLLKGTAFVAAGLDAGRGRSIGDLDILVPRDALLEAERALLAAGWEWVKEDAYDDAYYRRWMHELPPLIHVERDRMIDVAVPLGNGLSMLSPADMIVHAAAHLFADGDLAGGLRNLWDIDRLLREQADEGFWPHLRERAERHQLRRHVERAVRLTNDLYRTPIPESWRAKTGLDPLFRRRLLVRDGWGRQRHAGTRFAFYVRSHWLRMPPLMLARHLWTKAIRKPA
jgi:hypothetical protein